MAAVAPLPRKPTELNVARVPRRVNAMVAAHRACGLLEWFLSQRALLIVVSSLMLLCTELNLQTSPQRLPIPDLGASNGADILDPEAGVALSRKHALVHNRARGQQAVVMRRLSKAPVCHVGVSDKKCTSEIAENSADDPIEVLERTGRTLVAAKKRSTAGDAQLDHTLGKQLVEIYGALANIYRSRKQHFEAFHMMRLADEASASAHLEL